MTSSQTTTPKSAARLAYSIAWVKDVPAAVSFYRDVFGLSPARVEDRGRFIWAEFATGSTILAFAGQGEAEDFFPAGFHANAPDQPPNANQISFQVEDAAFVYAEALAHGAAGLRAPIRQDWGAVWAQLRDPNGVLVSLVQFPG
jgi:catechol 2,3-dioxygenase-like lactoylglutathione lyase family enzyme